mmetsp:Transcript_3055/g.12689  ORF Transcript_3055/g.12689 Transcript_3055/m.12689 type:complete len:268 (-) Transcript_3055:341-1144(-)
MAPTSSSARSATRVAVAAAFSGAAWSASAAGHVSITGSSISRRHLMAVARRSLGESGSSASSVSITIRTESLESQSSQKWFTNAPAPPRTAPTTARLYPRSSAAARSAASDQPCSATRRVAAARRRSVSARVRSRSSSFLCFDSTPSRSDVSDAPSDVEAAGSVPASFESAPAANPRVGRDSDAEGPKRSRPRARSCSPRAFLSRGAWPATVAARRRSASGASGKPPRIAAAARSGNFFIPAANAPFVPRPVRESIIGGVVSARGSS